MLNFIHEYKAIFLRNRGWPWNFPKTCFPYWSSLKTCFRVRQEPKYNLLTNWILIQGSKMQKPGQRTQNHFPVKASQNLKFSIKIYRHIRLSYKFVLKLLKSLSWMFWVIEYLYKAKKYQTLSTAAKPFFWKSEVNLETFQQPSPYIGVSYKFILKSAKSLNQIFWAMEYWFKAS